MAGAASVTFKEARRFAALGGAYGNLAALGACLQDVAQAGGARLAFLGDAIGCCGHSQEILAMVRDHFDMLVAGNHEQQAAVGADTCGCGYASAEDEATSCEAFRLATEALDDDARAWLGSWPERAIVDLPCGPVLLCHGSPGHTSEFLYECELDDLRLEAWLDVFGVRGFVATHSGLPWIRRLRGGRFAVNCGAVGKPDHDGDPAVHYALIDCADAAAPRIEIRRVTYDHEGWARRLEHAGIAPVFVEPIRTGVWTTGVASLPVAERYRYLRGGSPGRTGRAWDPDFLDSAAFRHTLAIVRELGLVTAEEIDQAISLLDPGFPFFGAARLANSVHVHVKVEDVARLPHAEIVKLGVRAENARDGYVKYPFPGGLNLIFSSIDVTEEDHLPPTPSSQRSKPFVDHFGVDLRRETGIVRAAFDDIPALALRAGWAYAAQGGPGRAPVYCCHAVIAQKHWVYPPTDSRRFFRPVEFAFGPLQITGEMKGCDLRPVDPRHPEAAALAICAAEAAARHGPSD